MLPMGNMEMVPIFTLTTEVWSHANQAVVTNNLTVLIEVVLIEGFLYVACCGNN